MTDKRAMVADASSKRQVEFARRLEGIQKQRQADDMRALLATPGARRAVFAWLDRFGMYGSVFDRDALVMAFQSGQQDAMRAIAADIEEVEPGAVSRLWEEAQAEKRASLRQAETIQLTTDPTIGE